MIKNILITGATGFVGKHLLRRLVKDAKYKITILVRKNSNLDLIEELKDQVVIGYYNSEYSSIDELFRNGKFDLVLHLAAVSCYDCPSENIANMIDSNIKFGTFILEAMKKYGCKYFINTSTYWQNYESEKYEPICLYAATKKAFEDIIDYYSMDKIKAISLKLFDVYGYDDHRNKLLNTLLKQGDSGVIDLTHGEQKLYMVFIDDVIDAYKVAMDLVVTNMEKHSIYGVYGNDKYSLKEVIKMAEDVTNKKFNINFGAKSYNQFQIMDSFAENKLPMWDAKFSLKEGLRRIIG